MSRVLIGLVFLAALAAGGAWNYQRNLESETGKRPFARYSDDQLYALASGYEGEVNQLSERYERQRGQAVRETGGKLLGENVAAFDRVHSRGAKMRRLGGDLSQREAELEDVRLEIAHRSRERWRVFLERLLTI
jgi:hypothetical protein